MRERATFRTGPDGSLILAVDPGEDAAFDRGDVEVSLSGTTIEITAPVAGPVELEAVHGERD